MILRPSPIRKSPAPLRGALRALVVSACALTAPAALSHPSVPRRSVVIRPSVPATHPYLALLVPTPLRFAAPERAPAVLEIEPLPEEDPSQDAAATANANASTDATNANPLGDLSDFQFSLPTTTELDAAIAEMTAASSEDAKKPDQAPAGPPPILLPEDGSPDSRPEDIMPFFRLPSAPSSATYQKVK